jgi:glutamate synthase (NADPH/NADH) small chain
VLLAMGFLHVEHEGLIRNLDLKLDEKGNVSDFGELSRAADSYQTSEPWVFAAGDTINGASLVVSAINSGREAAAAIDCWLRGT